MSTFRVAIVPCALLLGTPARSSDTAPPVPDGFVVPEPDRSPPLPPCEGELRDRPSRPLEELPVYAIANREVTQREWKALVGRNPSYHAACEDCPVERVTWYGAVTYANRLSLREGLDACYRLDGCTGDPGGDYACTTVTFSGPDCRGYRLPTEAEWERAARLIERTCLADETQSVWNRVIASNFPVFPVPPTEGISGLLDNVWEWTHDAHASAQGGARWVRGGTKLGSGRYDHATFRYAYAPNYHGSIVGFRLVRTLPSAPELPAQVR